MVFKSHLNHKKMAHDIHAIEEAISLLKKDGYIVYKRSTKSPRIYDTLGISKLISITKKEEDLSEKRMNIIGQNGNDGLHYK